MRKALLRGFRRRAAVSLVAAAALVGAGCDLDEVEIPDFNGPSELGTAVRMTASPDILVANGFSRSVIEATVRNQNGDLVRGMEIVFTIADPAGAFADIGSFVSPPSFRDVGTAVSVVTDANGVARTIYESPSRTDFTANSSVVVAARPVGTDFNGAQYRTVRIELRSAEPRLFPANPANTAPVCNFNVQAPNGYKSQTTILFQTTSSDADGTIVRYEWFFSDGTQNDHPDTAHVFRTAGTYQVTHVVTDNNGLQSACAVTLSIS